MRAFLGTWLALGLACGATAEEKKGEKIDAKLLVGKWTQVAPKGGPQVKMEFSADGTASGIVEATGATYKITGTYKLDGDKLTTVTRLDEMKQETKGGGTITTLTDKALELTDTKGIKLRLERVKK